MLKGNLMELCRLFFVFNLKIPLYFCRKSPKWKRQIQVPLSRHGRYLCRNGWLLMELLETISLFLFKASNYTCLFVILMLCVQQIFQNTFFYTFPPKQKQKISTLAKCIQNMLSLNVVSGPLSVTLTFTSFIICSESLTLDHLRTTK